MKNPAFKTATKKSLGRKPKKATGNTEADYKKWYKLKIWVKVLRPKCLERDNFTCQMCETNLGHRPDLLVADHKIPHKGVWKLFTDLNNLWTLCRSCHSKEKQLIEMGAGYNDR